MVGVERKEGKEEGRALFVARDLELLVDGQVAQDLEEEKRGGFTRWGVFEGLQEEVAVGEHLEAV